MHRFYSEKANFNDPDLIITDADELHHIKNVLRLKKGDVIQIFNGQHEEADVAIEEFSSEGLKVIVKNIRQAKAKKTRLILACAPPKKDKFEWIIEKCTELGVDEIIPLKTKRSEVFYNADKHSNKLARFQKIVLNASKQSKRSDLTVVHPMMELSKVLKNLDPNGLSLFPSLNGHPPPIKELLTQFKEPATITIFIGPEGDFTPQEVEQAINAGCKPVSLGDTVLKVETAAVATVGFVRFYF